MQYKNRATFAKTSKLLKDTLFLVQQDMVRHKTHYFSDEHCIWCLDAVNHAPPPAPVQSGSGSMLGGIGSTIAQGISMKMNVAFGIWNHVNINFRFLIWYQISIVYFFCRYGLGRWNVCG